MKKIRIMVLPFLAGIFIATYWNNNRKRNQLLCESRNSTNHSKNATTMSLLKSNDKQAKRMSTYIRHDIHRIITQIVRSDSNKDLTVGKYIDAILLGYLETHQDEINELYRRARENLINID